MLDEVVEEVVSPQATTIDTPSCFVLAHSYVLVVILDHAL